MMKSSRTTLSCCESPSETPSQKSQQSHTGSIRTDGESREPFRLAPLLASPVASVGKPAPPRTLPPLVRGCWRAGWAARSRFVPCFVESVLDSLSLSPVLPFRRRDFPSPQPRPARRPHSRTRARPRPPPRVQTNPEARPRARPLPLPKHHQPLLLLPLLLLPPPPRRMAAALRPPCQRQRRRRPLRTPMR